MRDGVSDRCIRLRFVLPARLNRHVVEDVLRLNELHDIAGDDMSVEQLPNPLLLFAPIHPPRRRHR
jgi:hypothetical protein